MRPTYLFVAVLAACILTSACQPVSGGPCDQIGSQHKDEKGNILFTCVKNDQTGKGYWYKGKY